MKSNQQKFGNATRIVVRGQYTPTGTAESGPFTKGADWFSFANLNYPSIDALKTAYGASPIGEPLHSACDKMFEKLRAYVTAHSSDFTLFTASKFDELTGAMLDEFPNGGQIIKDGKNPVIRWYQDSRNYWYYEIRHDKSATGVSQFAKYGMVRNNWYAVQLDYVHGPGTPWYPEIVNPGPGDPDGPDDIDGTESYLGIDIYIQPWIMWETGIGFD